MADIAMLVPDPNDTSPNLGLLISRIEGLGHTVSLFDHDTAPDDTALLTNDAVVFSPLGFSEPTADGFWNCPLPILAHGRMGHNSSTLGIADRGDPSSGSDNDQATFITSPSFDDTTDTEYEGLRGAFVIDTPVTVGTANIGGRNMPDADVTADAGRVLWSESTANRWGWAAALGKDITDFSGPTTIPSPSNRVHYPTPDSTGDYDLLTEDGWLVFVDLPVAWLLDETPTYELDVTVVGNGNVDLSPEGPYEQGEDTEVTLTANADIGHEFTGWSGDLSGSVNPETIIMSDDREVTATFEEIPPDHIRVIGGSITGSLSNG